jgi:hypothetical protein
MEVQGWKFEAGPRQKCEILSENKLKAKKKKKKKRS